jgi:RNA polymerase sigma factor (sigma-70 family)
MSVIAGREPVSVGGLSDEELVQLAREGYEPAFEAIVNRYRGALVSYCRRWLDAHRAEEVVQHTLMKAFLCLRDDDRPLALRPWLYRVAHNAALNALEKKGGDWEQLDENYDGVPQPPQVAEQRARFLKVVDEIEALPERQREALLLNEFEGRCYADIAAELGTSESGVRGLLRRARRQLRETAAAALLPFPVLRELIRSDGGRSLQPDRAGEAIGAAGAAGAAGGVGAAGGLAKVAAGVIAAGTIAGGGTALEHGPQPWRTPEAKAVAPAAAAPPAAASRDSRLVVATAGDERHPAASRRIALSPARLVPQGAPGPPPREELAASETADGAEPAEGDPPVDGDPLAAAPDEDPTAVPGVGDEPQEGDGTPADGESDPPQDAGADHPAEPAGSGPAGGETAPGEHPPASPPATAPPARH